MSFALKELSTLLAQRDAASGVVVQVGDSEVRVATSAGAVTARATAGLAVGERVIVRGGWAERAPVARQVFSV